MNHRITKLLCMSAALIGVACIDMSAPGGAASISTLQLPSPSVVVGDVMRDSNGAPAPLSVIAYDANNNPISGLSGQFYISDSTHAAHLDPGNIVVGDKIGASRIIGQIGSLQTAALTVPVTYAPDHLTRGTVADSVLAPLGRDSATSIGTLVLPVSVRSVNDSASQGFIVSYVISHAPATATSSKSPAVYLTSDNGRLATSDTSDVVGATSPKLVVNSFELSARDTIYAGTKTDSVVVLASAKYKGVLLAGSPVRFVVRVIVK